MSWLAGNVHVEGTFSAGAISIPAGTMNGASLSDNAGIVRTQLAQESLVKFSIPLTNAKVWDALGTDAPITSSADDLGLYATVAGVKLATGAMVGTSVTRKTGFVVSLPENYDAGQDVQIQVHAGTIGGTGNVSCTVDCEVFKSNRSGGVSADLQATAAIDMNSATFADKVFTVTPTGFNPGDSLIVIFTIACDDTGGGGSLEAAIGAFDLLLDIRG